MKKLNHSLLGGIQSQFTKSNCPIQTVFLLEFNLKARQVRGLKTIRRFHKKGLARNLSKSMMYDSFLKLRNVFFEISIFRTFLETSKSLKLLCLNLLSSRGWVGFLVVEKIQALYRASANKLLLEPPEYPYCLVLFCE